MTIEIKVPILPESVPDAILLDWNKKVGDSVRRDEIIVEVETDKVVLEVPAPSDGVITELKAEPGDTVLGDQLIAVIEAVDPAAKSADAAPSGDQEVTAEDHDVDELGPAARRLVTEYGINPEDIKGTGRDGRLTKEDVLNHIASQVTPDDSGQVSEPAKAAESAPNLPQSVDDKSTQTPVVEDKSVPGSRIETREPMSRLRQTIAQRLVQSQQGAALLTTFNEVNMQPVMELRSKYKEEFEKKHGTRLGFMSFFVRASVVALERFPLVNAYIDGTDIVKHNYHDIGIAVSSPRGLVVPI